jgi:hypothetical protein
MGWIVGGNLMLSGLFFQARTMRLPLQSTTNFIPYLHILHLLTKIIPHHGQVVKSIKIPRDTVSILTSSVPRNPSS